MQNQLYNTHLVANKTYKLKEYMEANVSIMYASKKKKPICLNQLYSNPTDHQSIFRSKNSNRYAPHKTHTDI